MKNGYHLVEDYSTAKFPITDPPPKSLGLYFSECQWKWKIGISHYEKLAPISQKTIIQQNFQLPIPQSLGPYFSKCQWKWHQPFMKKLLPHCGNLFHKKFQSRKVFNLGY